MNVRIKKICAVFVTGLLAVSLFACGKKADEPETGIAQKETQKIGEEQESRDRNPVKETDETSEDMAKTENETEAEVDSKDEKTEADAPKGETTPKKATSAEKAENDESVGGETTEQPDNNGADEASVKKVAEVVELFNEMMPGMMPENIAQHAAVSFSAYGTVVHMNLHMKNYSAAQMTKNYGSFEAYANETVDAEGIVSLIKAAEPAVTAVNMSVYGNDGGVVFSEVYE